MRPMLLRRFVAGLVASAFFMTLGLQGMHAAAMAPMAMSGEMHWSMVAPSDGASGVCANCDGSGKAMTTLCQPACASAVAVLPAVASISCVSQAAHSAAENRTREGRTGRPEPHPPKFAAPL